MTTPETFLFILAVLGALGVQITALVFAFHAGGEFSPRREARLATSSVVLGFVALYLAFYARSVL